jgi:hypothetical protein
MSAENDNQQPQEQPPLDDGDSITLPRKALNERNEQAARASLTKLYGSPEAGKAVAEHLKAHGIDPAKLNEHLAELKALREAKLTDDERRERDQKARDEALAAARAETEQLRAANAAHEQRSAFVDAWDAAGYRPDRRAAAYKLLADDLKPGDDGKIDFAGTLAEFSKAYPELTAAPVQAGATTQQVTRTHGSDGRVAHPAKPEASKDADIKRATGIGRN